MANAAGPSPHTFHIPVMGTGFMIDAPLRVAKYGISSVISLVDDVLIEQMRRFHCEKEGEPYEEIGNEEEDARARRITAYLNLLDRPGPPAGRAAAGLALRARKRDHPLFRDAARVAAAARVPRRCWRPPTPDERLRRQDRLRRLAVPGSIDVNIMSKGDRDVYRNGEKLPAKYSDASAALRGFAESTLASSIVFSAGMNPRLYSYAAEFADFFPDAQRRAQEEDHPQGQRLPFGRGAGAISGQARAVGVGIPRRVGPELRRPCLRHQGAAAGPDPGRVRSRRSGNSSSNCTRRTSRPWPSAACASRQAAPRRSHHGARRHRHRRGRPAAAGVLRRRRHRLGNPVPAGARGHERRRRASSETVRRPPTATFI